MKSGCYVCASNWEHRLYLKFDVKTLSVAMDHFIVNFHTRKASATRVLHRYSLDSTVRVFPEYFDQFHFLKEMDLSTYHLKRYGFIMVHHGASPGNHEMQFCGGKKCWIRENQPTIIKDSSLNGDHFKVTLNRERLLIVECLLPADSCVCEPKLQALHPFSWEVDDSYNALIVKKDIDEHSSPDPLLVDVHQVFKICPDKQVDAQTTFYVDYTLDKNIQAKVSGNQE